MDPISLILQAISGMFTAGAGAGAAGAGAGAGAAGAAGASGGIGAAGAAAPAGLGGAVAGMTGRLLSTIKSARNLLGGGGAQGAPAPQRQPPMVSPSPQMQMSPGLLQYLQQSPYYGGGYARRY